MKKFFALNTIIVLAVLMSACTVSRTQTRSGGDITAISDQQKDDLLAFVYGQGPFPNTLSDYDNPVILLLRQDGKRVGAEFIEGYSLEKNIETAKESVFSKSNVSTKELDNYSVHLHILGNRKLQDSTYELGSDAVKMVAGEKNGVYRGTFAIEENKNEQDMRTILCENLQLAKSCVGEAGVIYEYAPELHIARTESGVVTFYKGKLLDTQSAIDLGEIRKGITVAQKWLLENIDGLGKFTYVFNPTPGTYSTNNNLIRQFMASRILAEMSKDDENILTLHQRNLDYIFKTRYQEDKTNGWVLYAGTSKLGAIAILLRTLAASPILDTYKTQADKLAQTILDLQNSDGSFNPWWIEPTYAYDKEYLLTFYSGEGILGLIEYYLRTREQRRLDAAIKAQDYYLDRYVTQINENYYPAYVPRHTLSLYNLYILTQDARYADAIFTLNDKLIDEMLHTAVETGSHDLLGRFYNERFPQYGTPHSASDGVYVEGVAYAYEIAKMRGDIQRQEKYRTAIELGVHNLLNLQYDDVDAYFVEHPERVIGALRFSALDNRIRTDTTQHALDALVKIEQLFSEE